MDCKYGFPSYKDHQHALAKTTPRFRTDLLVRSLEDFVLLNQGVDILRLGELEQGHSVNVVGHCVVVEVVVVVVCLETARVLGDEKRGFFVAFLIKEELTQCGFRKEFDAFGSGIAKWFACWGHEAA